MIIVCELNNNRYNMTTVLDSFLCHSCSSYTKFYNNYNKNIKEKTEYQTISEYVPLYNHSQILKELQIMTNNG